ncbi:MAG: DUF2066 domain-containing protein [Succinivibrio sp.]
MRRPVLASLAAALIAQGAAFAAFAEDAGDPLVYEAPLSEGVDKALTAGYAQAAAALAPGSEPRAGAKEAGKAASVRIEGSRIVVSFDRDRLSRQLSSSGQAVWSGLKDPVLVWLADAGSGKIVGGDSSDPLALSMSAAAQKLRYQLIFPLMDLDDVQAVSAQSVLTHDDAALSKASARYKPSFYVAAASSSSGGDVDLRWDVYDAAGRKLGEGQAKAPMDDAAGKAAASIASSLMENVSGSGDQAAQVAGQAQPSAPAAAADTIGPRSGSVRILVSGIGSISDLYAVRSAIITFGYEGSTRAIGYTPQGVVFLVPTSASPAILDGTLAHSGTFTKTGDWIYRFNQGTGPADSGRDGQVGAPSYRSAASSPLGAGAAAPAAKAGAGGRGPRAARASQLVGDL